MKDKIKAQLEYLQNEFARYFPDLISEDVIWQLARNRFLVNVELLPEELEEEVTELQYNSLAKDSFQSMSLENFSIKYQTEEYPNASNQRLRLLIPFSSM
ncbi:hypothetical protein T11_18003 [Trichinella zimbabwensis]|uniref:Uncharacterized protein n=1 Tax=Trichinella zimbabwensis TaxID=268475 RepID=A0A0V1I6A0_9BILA|nr:hypothetical protein T11_18003 [Trichinella zimbabwensis]